MTCHPSTVARHGYVQLGSVDSSAKPEGADAGRSQSRTACTAFEQRGQVRSPPLPAGSCGTDTRVLLPLPTVRSGQSCKWRKRPTSPDDRRGGVAAGPACNGLVCGMPRQLTAILDATTLRACQRLGRRRCFTFRAARNLRIEANHCPAVVDTTPSWTPRRFGRP